jgi:hypothetical protein
MPPVIAKHIAHFERFYHTRHTGRRLAWQPNYGTADIRVAFKTRKHELNVSTLAMVVLLAFGDIDIGEELEYNVSWSTLRSRTPLTVIAGHQNGYRNSRYRLTKTTPVLGMR